jgi:hypothetical protein
MILLVIGADALAQLMAGERRGPDSAWLLHGPEADAVEREDARSEPSASLLAAE